MEKQRNGEAKKSLIRAAKAWHSWYAEKSNDKQRHGVEKLSPDQKCKGTDTLEKKRCDVLCNTETSNTRKSKETALNCWKGKETTSHSWQG